MLAFILFLSAFSFGHNCIHGIQVELWDECYNIEMTTSLNLLLHDITGEIPPEIGELINLTYLNLGSNELTGEIPFEISNLTNLHSLTLDNNQLSGEIPESIGNLVNLSWLSLHSNNLTGGIPESIGNLTNLIFLYLYNNQLVNIPDSICQIFSNISLFNISDNNFCPPYPECLAEEDIGNQNTLECVHENSIILHAGSNLISFNTVPEDNSVENVLSGDNISAIVGEGVAAMHTDMGWVGSLTIVLYEHGYWLVADEEDTLSLSGIPMDLDQLYAVHEGNNLISYSLPDCGSIDEVLPDEVEDCLYAIAGEGVAIINTNIGWMGSLTALCPNKGYWFVNQCSGIEFTFDEPTSFARSNSLSESPYPYYQSSKQAFYFIHSVKNIEVGDWILAYNGDKVIGAREWQGSIIDVPVMGSDGSKYTEGYMESGSTPGFKVLRDGKLIDLEGYVPAWSNNEFYVISSLSEASILPESFSLGEAFPNPFNPTTTINFDLKADSDVILAVYDINGSIIMNLIDNTMKAGCHSIMWNAEKYSSGVYFTRMKAGDFTGSQKLMLIK